MKYQLFADGKLIGVVDGAQRQEVGLEHLCGIKFIPVWVPKEPLSDIVTLDGDLGQLPLIGAVI